MAISCFQLLALQQGRINEKFSGMVNAFDCGAPPHGGMAPGTLNKD